jgi:hypothetical protein
MQTTHSLSAVSDDELLRRLAALVRESRHTEAEVVAHIGEVDARRLFAREAVPSMFQYCTERLHLSGAEAYLRIAAARASRQHPVILEMLADGRLHLTAIALLAPHLTGDNRDDLLARATHRSKREVEELVAEIAPRPDAPSLIRKMPERRIERVGGRCSRGLFRQQTAAAASAPQLAVLAGGASASPSPAGGPVAGDAVAGGFAAEGPVARGLAAEGLPTSSCSPDHAPDAIAPADAPALAPAEPQLRPDVVVPVRSGGMPAPAWRVEPLSPARYKVQFTASRELRDKLARLRDLMRPSVPDGDLVSVIDAAVTEKLERLERRLFGRRSSAANGPSKLVTRAAPATRPRAAPVSGAPETPQIGLPMAVDTRVAAAGAGLPTASSGGPASPETPISLPFATGAPYAAETEPTRPREKRARDAGKPRSRHVPTEVRGIVLERDGARCGFVDAQGRRCTARAWLELHHRHTFALGGEHSPENVGVRCRMHNQYLASIDYGRATMDRHRRRGRSWAVEAGGAQGRCRSRSRRRGLLSAVLGAGSMRPLVRLPRWAQSGTNGTAVGSRPGNGRQRRVAKQPGGEQAGGGLEEQAGSNRWISPAAARWSKPAVAKGGASGQRMAIWPPRR